MKLSRSIRRFLRLRRRPRQRPRQRPAFVRVDDEIRARTKAFISSTSLQARTTNFGRLFRTIWTGASERAFTVRLIRWIRLLEHDDLLRIDFQEAFQAMLNQLNSVSLFAEAGLPAHHAIISEGLRRIVQRFLPTARAESDASRLVVSLFSAPRDVERFLELPDYLFERLRILLWPPARGPAASSQPPHQVENDLRDQIAHNIEKGVLKSTADGEVKYSWRGMVYLWCQFLLDLVRL